MTDAATAANPMPKWLLQTFTRALVWLNRLTAGRAFNTLAGRDVCFVTMTGARSGRRSIMASADIWTHSLANSGSPDSAGE